MSALKSFAAWLMPAKNGTREENFLVPENVEMKNADLLQMMVNRKGGPVGTGGRAAFALRLDHGTDAFQEVLGPLLKKYGLPATMAVYSKQREVNAKNNSVPWQKVDGWFSSHGMTFANHSDDHRDKADIDGWHAGTIGSAAALAELLPSSPLESYMPHGSAEFERYGGFNRASTHEQIFQTPAGQMALSSHALISGYRGGRYRPLTGLPSQGLTHWSMERSDFRSFRRVIDVAIRHQSGVAVMFHPEFIGRSGRMEWATVESCLAYVAQKRDEGLLLPLTVEGLAVADSRSDRRDDLLRGAVRESVQLEVPGSTHEVMVNMAHVPWAIGSARSADWDVFVKDSVSVVVEVSDAEGKWLASRDVTLSGGAHVVTNPFGIPLGHSGNIVTRLRVVAGAIEIRKVSMLAN